MGTIVKKPINELLDEVSIQLGKVLNITFPENGFSEINNKLDIIIGQFNPIVEPTTEEKAQQALQALTDLQQKLAEQSADIPAPDRPWLDGNCNIKIWFPNKTILTMLKSHKGLVDFALGGQFVIDWTDIGVFIYLNWLDADAETAIVSAGGKIIQTM